MRMALRRAALVSAAAACVTLVTCGPASAASAGSLSMVSASTAAAAVLGNHQISGIERAIGCLTARRCVAVGYGGGRAAGQVVTVVAGRQVRVTVVRSASNLVAVSCPSRFGCWAIGAARKGHHNFVLVRIGPAGNVATVITVQIRGGVSLASISCASMTSCEVFGTARSAIFLNKWYLATWSGRTLSQPYMVGLVEYDLPGGISCWQATCVAVGSWIGEGGGSPAGDTILTTNGGTLGVVAYPSGAGLSGVSCVSSSVCYVATLDTKVATLNDGALGSTQNLPLYAGTSIECDGATCWAAGLSGNPPYPAEFVMIANGVPAGSAVIDRALTVPSPAAYPAITRRGNGFAAVGAAVNGGPRVSEVVTN